MLYREMALTNVHYYYYYYRAASKWDPLARCKRRTITHTLPHRGWKDPAQCSTDGRTDGRTKSSFNKIDWLGCKGDHTPSSIHWRSQFQLVVTFQIRTVLDDLHWNRERCEQCEDLYRKPIRDPHRATDMARNSMVHMLDKKTGATAEESQSWLT